MICIYSSMVVRLIFRHTGEARSDDREKEHTSFLLELCCTNELQTDEDERASVPHCQIQKIETSLILPEKSVPFHKVGFHDAASSGSRSLHPHEHGEEHPPGLRQQVRRAKLPS